MYLPPTLIYRKFLCWYWYILIMIIISFGIYLFFTVDLFFNMNRECIEFLKLGLIK